MAVRPGASTSAVDGKGIEGAHMVRDKPNNEASRLGAFLCGRFGSLENAFKALDPQSTGFLSRDDFIGSVQQLGYTERVENAYNTMDPDGQGQISFEEFRTAFSQDKKPAHAAVSAQQVAAPPTSTTTAPVPQSPEVGKPPTPWSDFWQTLEVLEKTMQEQLTGEQAAPSQRSGDVPATAVVPPEIPIDPTMDEDLLERVERLEAQLARETCLRRESEKRLAQQLDGAVGTVVTEQVGALRRQMDGEGKKNHVEIEGIQVPPDVQRMDIVTKLDQAELQAKLETRRQLLERRVESVEALVAQVVDDMRACAKQARSQTEVSEARVEKRVQGRIDACRQELEHGQTRVLAMAKQAVDYAAEASRACAGISAKLQAVGDADLCSRPKAEELIHEHTNKVEQLIRVQVEELTDDRISTLQAELEKQDRGPHVDDLTEVLKMHVSKLQAEWRSVFDAERARNVEQTESLKQTFGNRLQVECRTAAEKCHAQAVEQAEAVRKVLSDEVASLKKTLSREVSSFVAAHSQEAERLSALEGRCASLEDQPMGSAYASSEDCMSLERLGEAVRKLQGSNDGLIACTSEQRRIMHQMSTQMQSDIEDLQSRLDRLAPCEVQATRDVLQALQVQAGAMRSELGDQVKAQGSALQEVQQRLNAECQALDAKHKRLEEKVSDGLDAVLSRMMRALPSDSTFNLKEFQAHFDNESTAEGQATTHSVSSAAVGNAKSEEPQQQVPALADRPERESSPCSRAYATAVAVNIYDRGAASSRPPSQVSLGRSPCMVLAEDESSALIRSSSVGRRTASPARRSPTPEPNSPGPAPGRLLAASWTQGTSSPACNGEQPFAPRTQLLGALALSPASSPATVVSTFATPERSYGSSSTKPWPSSPPQQPCAGDKQVQGNKRFFMLLEEALSSRSRDLQTGKDEGMTHIDGVFEAIKDLQRVILLRGTVGEDLSDVLNEATTDCKGLEGRVDAFKSKLAEFVSNQDSKLDELRSGSSQLYSISWQTPDCVSASAQRCQQQLLGLVSAAARDQMDWKAKLHGDLEALFTGLKPIRKATLLFGSNLQTEATNRSKRVEEVIKDMEKWLRTFMSRLQSQLDDVSTEADQYQESLKGKQDLKNNLVRPEGANGTLSSLLISCLPPSCSNQGARSSPSPPHRQVGHVERDRSAERLRPTAVVVSAGMQPNMASNHVLNMSASASQLPSVAHAQLAQSASQQELSRTVPPGKAAFGFVASASELPVQGRQSPPHPPMRRVQAFGPVLKSK